MPPKRPMVQASLSEPTTKKRSRDTAIPSAITVETHRYQYPPVDTRNGQIRLLTIRPGSFGCPLEVTLDKSYQLSRFKSVELPGQESSFTPRLSSRSFDALSYTWGSPADPVVIRVGNKNKCLLSITRNLAIALPYLRHPDRDRVMWIDALCIDQLNFDERASQVQLMPDIYKEAKHVICWLGPASEDSRLAVRAIRELNFRLEVSLEDDIVKPRAKGDAHWADVSIPLPFSGDTMRAVSSLFGRSWFERLWIYQEVRLGGDRAVMQCGKSRVEWQKVVQANWCFRFKPWKENVCAEFRRRMGIVDRMHYPNPTNLALLIRRTSYLKCFDARDRVYAMMSTTRKEEQDMRIQADYKKPAGKIYQAYVEQFMRNFKSLRLLSFCEIQDHSLEMPTWVPDWSHPPCTNAPRASRYAAGYLKANVASISEDILEVTGVHVGTITQRISLDIGNGSDAKLIQLIRDSAPQEVLNRLHPGHIPMLNAYCCTLCFDIFSCRTSPERAIFPSFTQSLEFIETILNADRAVDILTNSEASKYLRYVAEACKGRCLVFTSSGHIGLAPAASKSDDHIYLLPGCRELMVLRSRLPSPGFQVVGQAYVHNMNDGEPMFGQFPGHFDAVLRCDNGVLRDLQFRNCESGLLQIDDPRLQGFSEEEMEEGLWTGKAPKIDALRARGVAFETLALV
jgi:hypothetical protein